MGCAYQDGNKIWWDEFWKATTDPGSKWLKTPIPKTGGTAILVPGQYLNVYKIDDHKGKPALCQRGEVKVWRDNNKDNRLDGEGEIYTGEKFGINIHRAGVRSEIVGGWSAGCQVIANIKDFKRMMALAYTQEENKRDTFTYTLLTEEEVDGVTKPSK